MWPQAASPNNQISGLASKQSEGLPGYWTKEELARFLNKSTRTLDRMHQERCGPPRISVGAGSSRSSVTLYKIDAVLAWLDSLQVGPVRQCRTSRRSAR